MSDFVPLSAWDDNLDERTDNVERSLYQRAVGYQQRVEKVFNSNGSISRVEQIEHVQPGVAAIKLWLTNRKSQEWACQ